VDNGSDWDAGRILANLDGDARRAVEIVRLGSNVGVGAGHNRGIKLARERESTHVLILDHDSVPRPDMVIKLSSALAALEGKGIPVAAVGPRWLDRYTGCLAPFVRLGKWKLERVYCGSDRSDEVLETDFIISSGALVPLRILDEIGDMNEGFFIDHVDTEWIFRARTKGYRSFGVCDAIMEHSLGHATFRFWLGRWRNVPLHSPERHYYVFRNSLMLLRMPHAPRRWLVNDIVRLASMAVVFPLFAPQRLRRVRLMLKGLWDGARGVTGPLG
jgi:rhamnosyltransferase